MKTSCFFILERKITLELKEHLDKVFKNMDKEDKTKKVEKELPKDKVYCNEFRKSENGFCTNYIGYKIDIESCAKHCFKWKAGERNEDRSNTKREPAKRVQTDKGT
ncbi:hypothetical protein [uncultured Clostridium sp.]|uniref:hypothetical protein n=1 Tax=uncultured Clostridium sp. TaxID=59620 RepID=UPI0028F14512|nr:hypothetical protein [uncultured Clostridium sp.]